MPKSKQKNNIETRTTNVRDKDKKDKNILYSIIIYPFSKISKRPYRFIKE